MVEAREFVKVWQASTSLSQVAAKTRTRRDACLRRAKRYRLRGVPLKTFPPPELVTTDEFWDDLKQYAASLLPEADAEPAAHADEEEPEDEGGARSIAEGVVPVPATDLAARRVPADE